MSIHSIKKRSNAGENLILLIAAACAVSISALFDHWGLSQKWDAAIMWTGVTFAVLVLSNRKALKLLRFWSRWATFLLLHLVLMWIIFSLLLAPFKVIGTLYVVPMAFVEALAMNIYFGKFLRASAKKLRVGHV
jgi:hypothetical protein